MPEVVSALAPDGDPQSASSLDPPPEQDRDPRAICAVLPVKRTWAADRMPRRQNEFFTHRLGAH